jgi:hypothetical protein
VFVKDNNGIFFFQKTIMFLALPSFTEAQLRSIHQTMPLVFSLSRNETLVPVVAKILEETTTPRTTFCVPPSLPVFCVQSRFVPL